MLVRAAAAVLAVLSAVPAPAGEAPAPPPDAAAAALRDLDRAHRRVYEKIRPAIVGVRAHGTLGEISGSGILLDAQGHVLTSSSVVGKGAQGVRVWLAGPRMASAQVIAVRPEEECALLKIEAKDLHPIAIGDSDALAVGGRVYSAGNAENVMINDDQAALSAGVVSATYGLREERMGSTYTGRVIETTAAVNPGMEGGALVDGDGRLVGMIVLNYSPLRWLGTAVPVKSLLPVVEEMRREEARVAAAPAANGGTPAAAGPPDAGIEFDAPEAGAAGLRIRSVAPDGPADAVGLAVGDRVLEAAGARVAAAADFEAQLRGLEPGALLWIKADIGGEVREIRLKLGAKSKP